MTVGTVTLTTTEYNKLVKASTPFKVRRSWSEAVIIEFDAVALYNAVKAEFEESPFTDDYTLCTITEMYFSDTVIAKSNSAAAAEAIAKADADADAKAKAEAEAEAEALAEEEAL